MHVTTGGCYGSGRCPMMKEEFRGGCHKVTARE